MLDIKYQNQDNNDLAEIKVENVFEEETKVTATTKPSEDLDEDKPLTSRYVLEWPSEYFRLKRLGTTGVTNQKSFIQVTVICKEVTVLI